MSFINGFKERRRLRKWRSLSLSIVLYGSIINLHARASFIKNYAHVRFYNIKKYESLEKENMGFKQTNNVVEYS